MTDGTIGVLGGVATGVAILLPRGFMGSPATLLQAVHFIEEYAIRFHRDFPALFGYHWTSAQYLTFNLIACLWRS